MRTISVSTDVFARIWALRKPGENAEDDILRRELGCHPRNEGSIPGGPVRPPNKGFYDSRHKVSFAEGFEVFRTYLGTKYRAHALGGVWVFEGDTRSFSSLNELSRVIGAKTENAWMNWFFVDKSGRRCPVSDLRNPETITPRRKVEKQRSSQARGGAIEDTDDQSAKSDGTWREDVALTLFRLGGRASLYEIYREVEILRRRFDRSVPPTLEATVRRTLEDHSSDSRNYRGTHDLFYMPEGKGAGVWALRKKVQ